METITIRIPKELREKLERLAKADKRSLSNLIRMVLEKGVKPGARD